MGAIRLLIRRSRMLDDERFATDEGIGDPIAVRKALAENARLLGIHRLPELLMLLVDGALRGLRAYQTHSYLQWLTWPLIGLLSTACLLGYVLGAGPGWLIGALFVLRLR